MLVLSFSFALSPAIGFAKSESTNLQPVFIGGEVTLHEIVTFEEESIPAAASENEITEINTEKEAKEFAEQLSTEDKAGLRESMRNHWNQFKINYENEKYCVPAGRITLAVGGGLAITYLLIPIAMLLAILALPVSAIDVATGCRVIYDL